MMNIYMRMMLSLIQMILRVVKCLLKVTINWKRFWMMKRIEYLQNIEFSGFLKTNLVHLIYV